MNERIDIATPIAPWLALCLLFIVLMPMCAFIMPDAVTAALLAGLSALVSVPFIYGGAERRINLFEPVTFMTIGLILAYPLRVLVVALDPDYAAQPLIDFITDPVLLRTGLLYSVLGIGAYLLAYYGAPTVLLRVGRSWSLATAVTQWEIRILIIFGVGWAFRAFMHVTGNFATTFAWSGFDPSTATLLWTVASLTWFAYILAWVNWLGRSRTLAATLTLAIITVVEAGYHFVFSGSKTFLTYSLLFPVMALALSRADAARMRKVMPGFLVVVLVVMFAVFPFIAEYRFVQGQGVGETSLSGNLDIALTAAGRVIGGDSQAEAALASDSWRDSVYPVLARWHGFDSLAVLVTRVPTAVDYVYGIDLLTLPFALVPRALFPWKPEAVAGAVFSNAVFHGESSTSPFPIGEAYFNFGVAGVVAVMALFGLCHRWFYAAYERRRDEPLAVAVYIYFFIFVITNIDSWMLSSYTAFVQRAAVIGLMCLLFVGVRRGCGAPRER